MSALEEVQNLQKSPVTKKTMIIMTSCSLQYLNIC